MNQHKFFEIINRINSVLLLILLSGGCLLIILGIVSSNRWQDRRAVEVVQNNDEDKRKKIELILGHIASIPGYGTQYVKLRSRSSGGKFSSSSGGGKTRNVLFFTGKEFNTHWLYKTHTFLINKFSALTKDIDKDKKKAIAIYIETIKSDTNRNGGLDRNDLTSISLTDPYGKNYTEIETQVESVVDMNVGEDGNFLILLLQKNNKVILKKYSLSTFDILSEKVIDEISSKL